MLTYFYLPKFSFLIINLFTTYTFIIYHLTYYNPKSPSKISVYSNIFHITNIQIYPYALKRTRINFKALHLSHDNYIVKHIPSLYMDKIQASKRHTHDTIFV